jgi:hypothetical protein
MRNLLIDAEPKPIEVDPARTAVVIIDMQRGLLLKKCSPSADLTAL